MFRNFSFNWISYILGILTGFLIFYIFSQAKLFFPRLSQWTQAKYEAYKKRQLAGADGAIRQVVIKRAQATHVGKFQAPLSEVVIPPSFLATPIQIIPGSNPPPESLSDELVPFLPFHPEFTAAFSPSRLSIQQLLSSRTNLAIVGHPGSGKSVTLAYLALILSHGIDDNSNLPPYLPLYLHVHDIHLIDNLTDPLVVLSSVIQNFIPTVFQKQVPTALQTALKQKQLILILDGFDNLHPETELPVYADFVRSIHKIYPDLLMVIAADPHNLKGLVQSQFQPYILAPFSEENTLCLFEKWFSVWAKNFLIKNPDSPVVDPRLLKFWWKSLPANLNPLEHTSRIISLLSGDLQQGQISYSGIETHLLRLVSSESERIALEKLAAEFVIRRCSVMEFNEIESILNKNLRMTEKQISAVDVLPTESKEPVRKIRLSSKSDKKSSGAQLIERLISAGVFQEHSQNYVGFCHPQVIGYLAAFALPSDLPRALFENLFWPSNAETLHYVTTQGGKDLWVDTLLRLDDRPLYWIHFSIGRWLRDTPSSSIWRSNFLRQIVTLLHKEDIPLLIRSDFYAALLSSGDSSLGVVIKQLSESRFSAIRRLSAMAIGYIRANGMISDLINLISDPDPEVGLTAILSMGAFSTPQTDEICSDVLQNAGELERQVAAESLVRSNSGRKILITALSSDDLLTRRAVIHGLSLHRSLEIVGLLERTSVEDGQWIVRTAASEALEWIRRPDPHLATPLSEPTETPWLISFTSKSGIVFSRGQAVTPILLDVLKNGTPEERLRAIDYLALEIDEGVVGALFGILYGSSEVLSRSAIRTLWLIMAGGTPLPSQTKYGYG